MSRLYGLHYSLNMRSQMRNTTSRQAVRITVVFVAGVAGLFAQSPSDSLQTGKPELIALNRTNTVSYLTAQEPAPTTNAPSQSTPTADLKSLPPSIHPTFGLPPISPSAASHSNAVTQQKAAGHSWFTAGLAALPPTARIDPTVGLPGNQYGAAPAAVRFSFGRK
jgi:hypothetical protein